MQANVWENKEKQTYVLEDQFQGFSHLYVFFPRSAGLLLFEGFKACKEWF